VWRFDSSVAPLRRQIIQGIEETGFAWIGADTSKGSPILAAAATVLSTAVTFDGSGGLITAVGRFSGCDEHAARKKHSGAGGHRRRSGPPRNCGFQATVIRREFINGKAGASKKPHCEGLGEVGPTQILIHVECGIVVSLVDIAPAPIGQKAQPAAAGVSREAAQAVTRQLSSYPGRLASMPARIQRSRGKKRPPQPGRCDGQRFPGRKPQGMGIVEPSRAAILHARFGPPRFMPGGPPVWQPFINQVVAGCSQTRRNRRSSRQSQGRADGVTPGGLSSCPFEARSANTSPKLRPFLFDSGWRAHAMAGFPQAPDSPQIPDSPAAFLESRRGYPLVAWCHGRPARSGVRAIPNVGHNCWKT
jgi:hypothetical protein